MFAAAVRTVCKYTQPVVISTRLLDGTVVCGCATFIHVNSEGWVLTAAHVLEPRKDAEAHAVQRAEYQRDIDKINLDRSLSGGKRQRLVGRLKHNKRWITNHSYWWASDVRRISEFHVDRIKDLALGRIENFTPSENDEFPKFADPSVELEPGTSLCRLGFPFHEISATFDERENVFRLAEGVLPLPRFPNDGIHTRIQIRVDVESGRSARFIETSTPGLRGQSGGPLFDVHGRVWGIQSSTQHLSLGFAPAVKIGNRETVEHQFMHVGLATHVAEIIGFLDEWGVRHTIFSS